MRFGDLGPAWDAHVRAEASGETSGFLQALAREADELMALVPDDETLDDVVRCTFRADVPDEGPASRTREILRALRDCVRALPGCPPGEWPPANG